MQIFLHCNHWAFYLAFAAPRLACRSAAASYKNFINLASCQQQLVAIGFIKQSEKKTQHHKTNKNILIYPPIPPQCWSSVSVLLQILLVIQLVGYFYRKLFIWFIKVFIFVFVVMLSNRANPSHPCMRLSLLCIEQIFTDEMSYRRI